MEYSHLRRTFFQWKFFFRFRVLLLAAFVLIFIPLILLTFDSQEPEDWFAFELPEKDNNNDYYYQLYRGCYSHEISNNRIYNDSVDFYDDLFTSNKQPEIDNSIFFIDSNCSRSGLTSISVRQACAYESAALHNPHREIFVVHLSPFGLHVEEGKWPTEIRLLMEYSNINFRIVKLDDLYEDTIFADWELKDKLFTTRRFEKSSDLARLLILYRFGGIYMDSDFIVFRNLSELGTNWMALEHEYSINNAVMNLDQNGTGHFIASECLRDIHDDFRAKVRDYNGPRVVTKIVRKLCDIKAEDGMKPMTCSGFTILPVESFYALQLDEVKQQVNSIKSAKTILEKIEASYGMHLWNVISKRKRMKLRIRSALEVSMKKNCPLVYEHFKVY